MEELSELSSALFPLWILSTFINVLACGLSALHSSTLDCTAPSTWGSSTWSVFIVSEVMSLIFVGGVVETLFFGIGAGVGTIVGRIAGKTKAREKK